MKKIILCLLIFMLIFSMSSVSFASAVTNIQNSGKTIVNAIAWCGYAVSVLMMVFIGIKYILGSADAKANMKTAITGYLIGAAIVFSASAIMQLVVNLIPDSSINSAESTASAIVNYGLGGGSGSGE